MKAVHIETSGNPLEVVRSKSAVAASPAEPRLSVTNRNDDIPAFTRDEQSRETTCLIQRSDDNG
jgi:hypothetical protein